MKDREVKRRAREDKRVWLEQAGKDAEKYAENESRQKRWSSWSEVRGAAQDRASWRETVTALCASWRDEK